jgi:hypothetical protein
MLLAAFFLLPATRGKGLRVGYATWNRAGLLTAVLYLAAALYAHRAALGRVKEFASLFQLQVESLGALPFPPSLWHWDGLVSTAHGVYEVRLDLSEPSSRASIEHRYYPDAIPNPYIDRAKRLPEVQTVFWFSRFPVTRFHKEGSDAIVEIYDARFPQVRRDRPASFTYRVKMDESGAVLSQGWERE